MAITNVEEVRRSTGAITSGVTSSVDASVDAPPRGATALWRRNERAGRWPWTIGMPR